MRLFGITGLNGSGKTAAVQVFVENGFRHCSASELIREYLEEFGEPDDRSGWRRAAVLLRETYGEDFIVEEFLRRHPGEDLVIESIRAVPEAEAIKRRGVLVAIHAPVDLRFARLKERGRAGDEPLLEDFASHERAELANPGSASQNLSACIALADHVVENDGSLQELRARIERLL